MLLFGGKMKLKILLKYILLYIPFILGIVLLSIGGIDFLSFLLLIVGGYIAIKNTFDYRLVRKHIKKIKINNEKINQSNEIKNEDNKVKKIEPMIVENKDVKIKTKIRKK
jgi:hypothetical protein